MIVPRRSDGCHTRTSADSTPSIGDECRFDLGRFEPDAVDLELVVHAAAVHRDAGPLDPGTVAGSVPAGGRLPVEVDESLGRSARGG